MKPNFSFEIELSNSYSAIAGVDEVGRGALAGPIVVAAVIFSNYEKIMLSLNDIDDSKKLTEKQREELDSIIKSEASGFSFGSVAAEEIDKIGIGAANVLAFKRALDGLKNCDFALIDGRKFRGFEYKYRCLEKGESKSISIAAASIIAKVYRDNLMEELAKTSPEYDLENNKGYGSKNHFAALEKVGPSILHRKSFLNCLKKEQSSLDIF